MAPGKKKTVKPPVNSETDKKLKASDKSSINVFYRAPLKNISLNIVKQFDSLQHNGLLGCHFQRSGEHILVNRLKNYDIFQTCSKFDKRVTAISWHPKRMFFIAGSKAGDLYMFSLKDHSFIDTHQWSGGGPGLSILNIHFPELFENKMLTASIDGTVKLWDLVKLSSQPEKTLLSTGTIERWYCSVNTSVAAGLTVSGDTKGVLTLMDKDLKVTAKHQIHESKINTAEFNKRDNWLLATASVDKYVKLFDVRHFSKPVESMLHAKGINSAYFSNTNSRKLLTTDQNDEIRVYGGPGWEKILTIEHPHRQYMYLTPIRASWHPQSDLIVVGRYPDPKKPNYMDGELCTVDIFNDTGELKCQLYSYSCIGILSLNEFNPGGEYMVSSMGLYIPLWRYKDPLDKNFKRKLKKGDGSSGNNDNDDDDNDEEDNDDSSKKKKPRPNKKPPKGKPANSTKKSEKGTKSKKGR